jgi:hypothetical protein
MIFFDFSDIAEANLDYAKYLIVSNDYLEFNDANQLSLTHDFYEQAESDLQQEKYPFRLFWINLSLGIEILAKAVLIQHKIDIFSRKDDPEFESGSKVIARNNDWLKAILDAKNIVYVSQIHTGTVGQLYKKYFKQLKKKQVISKPELQLIEEGLKALANHRRNNDLHFYFKRNVFIKENDLTQRYIPLVNLLLDIFNRPATQL